MGKNLVSSRDRPILQDLARQVADIAADPVMARRRRLWADHNSLKNLHPMMLVFPEGAWIELVPVATLRCEGAFAREAELDLRKIIYTYEHFQDDSVVEAEWIAPDWWDHRFIKDTGWGVEIERHSEPDARGAFGFKPVLRESADIEKLHFPEIIYDEKGHLEFVAEMQELFGEWLTVRKTGIKHISFHMMKECTGWIGLEETLYAMIDRPAFVHEVMTILEEGNQRYLDQLFDMNLLSLNNDNTYQSTGGVGYTDELPRAGFDPQRVRTMDMWGSSESQEFQGVSPAMHAEFALQYETRLLARFGLTGYGCCEDLSNKLDIVFTIPNLRRISISPFADVAVSAARLKGDYIFSWKPQPAHLVGDFDEGRLRDYLARTLALAQEHGNVLEIILKDTHTCEHRPARFDRWTQICRELIGECSEQGDTGFSNAA